MTVYRTVIPRKAAFFSYPLFSFSYPASPKYSCSRIIATIPALKRKTAPDLSLDGFIILDEGLSDFEKVGHLKPRPLHCPYSGLYQT